MVLLDTSTRLRSESKSYSLRGHGRNFTEISPEWPTSPQTRKIPSLQVGEMSDWQLLQDCRALEHPGSRPCVQRYVQNTQTIPGQRRRRTSLKPWSQKAPLPCTRSRCSLDPTQVSPEDAFHSGFQDAALSTRADDADLAECGASENKGLHRVFPKTQNPKPKTQNPKP